MELAVKLERLKRDLNISHSVQYNAPPSAAPAVPEHGLVSTADWRAHRQLH